MGPWVSPSRGGPGSFRSLDPALDFRARPEPPFSGSVPCLLQTDSKTRFNRQKIEPAKLPCSPLETKPDLQFTSRFW